uniref:40S ribosomal protein S15 n=1 Tax=Piliocolobus tephrosceles TaxID=591936 RepID=A0A8C9IIM3_9PRIM
MVSGASWGVSAWPIRRHPSSDRPAGAAVWPPDYGGLLLTLEAAGCWGAGRTREQLMQLYSARQRRRLNRGLRRKQHSLLKRLRKAKKEAPPMEKPEVVKTHLRDMIILPEMVGSMVGVYNGKTFNQVEIKVRAAVPANRTGPEVGWGRLTRAGSPDTELCSWSPAARDDWPLPGRVLHHLQAREARPARHWSHPLLPLHPSQVVAQLIKAHLAPVLRAACSSRCPGLWEGPGPGSGSWCEEIQGGRSGLCGRLRGWSHVQD